MEDDAGSGGRPGANGGGPPGSPVVCVVGSRKAVRVSGGLPGVRDLLRAVDGGTADCAVGQGTGVAVVSTAMTFASGQGCAVGQGTRVAVVSTAMTLASGLRQGWVGSPMGCEAGAVESKASGGRPGVPHDSGGGEKSRRECRWGDRDLTRAAGGTTAG